MTKAKTKSIKKVKPIKMVSVAEVMAEGTPIEQPEAIPASHVVFIRATRNFDQMVRGEKIVVDRTEKYWADNLRGGNVEEVV